MKQETSSEKNKTPAVYRFRRTDAVLLSAVLLLSLLLFGFFLLKDRRIAAPMLEVSQGGTVTGVYPLDRDCEIPIGETNVCRIENGKVRMIRADCPDQSCMRSLPIDGRGGTIICLPNRVVLRIIDGTGGLPDAVAE